MYNHRTLIKLQPHPQFACSFFLFILLVLLSTTSLAQAWQPLGADDFNYPSSGAIDDVNFTAGPDGTLYVAYEDYDYGLGLTVRKYNGSIWTYVGMPGFSASSMASDICLVIAPDSTPYISYKDGGSGEAIVKKYNGSAWADVGASNFSGADIIQLNLAIAPDGTPYISYNSISNGLSIKKYNGSTWIDAGSLGVSTYEAAFEVKLAIGPDGMPYIAYKDNSDNDFFTPAIATVKKFNGTVWANVGLQGLPAEFTSSFKLVIATDGSPYLAYSDAANGNKATVKKFNGSAWVYVGNPGFSEIGTNDIVLAIAPNGTAFVCYDNSIIKKYNGSSWVNLGTPVTDACCFTNIAITNGVPCIGYHGRNERAGVRKYNGSEWQYLSDFTALTGYGGSNDLAISPDGTPYIAIQQEDINPSNKKAIVKKFNTGSWVDVGTPGFSAGEVSYLTLAIAPDSTPYAAYADGANSGRATVKKYNGSNWVDVGTPGFSSDNIGSVSLTIASNSTPWIAYQDWGNSGKATVKKYNGSTWETAGAPGFSANGANYISLCLSPSDTPYIAYQDGDFGKATVKKFNGSAWQDVGLPDVTTGRADDIRLSIAPNGTLYIAYADAFNGSRVSVKKFTGSAWVDVGTPLSDGYPVSFGFDIAPDGNPYVAYSESGGITSGRATVKKYNASTWEIVGIPNFSSTMVNHISFAISKDGSRAVVAYGISGSGTFAKYFTLNYTFNGTGGWSNANNWANKTIPPAMLPNGSEIVITPSSDGECIVDTKVIITPNSKLTVKPGKKMRISGALIIK